jgi:Protein of unknown function (DUF732)
MMTTTTKHALAALTLAAAALVAVSPAHADANDDAYVAALRAHGVLFTGPDQGAISAAHQACQALDGEMTKASIVSQAAQAEPGLDLAKATTIIDTAVQFYCPWDASK